MNKLKNIMLIMLSCLLLVACASSEYDKAIDEVIQLENESIKNEKGDFNNHLERNKVNLYVYEKGNVTILEYSPRKDNSYLRNIFYRKNLTKNNYELEYHSEKAIEQYMSMHEPDYKEINIK